MWKMTSPNPYSNSIPSVAGEQGQIPEVKCSWNVGNDKHIQDAVTISDECESTLDETVSLETCILLSVPPENPTMPCSLEICLPQKLIDGGIQIEQLTVVSEARVIEVYGHCGEYLSTVHASFVDDFAEMVVYLADISFKKPLSECSLKFARLHSSNEMWLYGIRLSAKKQKEKCIKPKFDMENIGEILKNQKLGDKTEMFKKFVNTYGRFTEKQVDKLPDPQTLLQMLGADLRQHAPLGTGTKTVSQCLSELVPRGFLGGGSKTTEENQLLQEHYPEKCSGDTVMTNEFQILETRLSAHIDKKLLEIEQRLLSSIEKQIAECEKRQMEKLDIIIGYLKEKT